MWLPTEIANDSFTKEYVDFNKRYQTGELSNSDWKEWRETKFIATIEKTKNSLFYQKHINYGDIKSLADIEKIPFTTKDHLRENMGDILSGSLNDALYFYETTGTTGRATPCPRDYKEAIASNSQVTAAWREIFDSVFGKDYRPIVGLMGPTEVHSFGDTLGSVCQNMNVCNMKIWPYSPVIGFPKALELMNTYGVEVIACTPGVAMNLMKSAKHYGYDLKKDFKVKAIFLTGEMSTPGLMKNITSIWGAQVFNCLYGSQEAFVIASSRSDGDMYIAKPNYIFEVIDPETNKSLGSTGKGELCLTMLINGIKPLVRYRTGDFVEIYKTEKPEPYDLKINIIGRTKDRIQLNGNMFSAFDIESSILDQVTHCYGYQIIIDQKNGEDYLDIKLEFAENAPNIETMLAAVKASCARQLRINANVEVIGELDQVVSTAAFVSWKAARIVDRRTKEIDSETQVAQKMAANRGYR